MDGTSERIISKLRETLEELNQLYSAALGVAAKEKDVLLQADLDHIQNINQEKEILFQKLRLTDALREARATELASLLGLSSSFPRLLEIAEAVGGEQAESLRKKHQVLEKLIRHLSQVNRENAQYANSALRTLNGAMNEIKDTLSGKKVYERKGTYKRGPEVSGHFVSKEA